VPIDNPPRVCFHPGMRSSFDVIVLGSGVAGLTYALKMAEHGEVAIITKREARASNTFWAQGGIATVMDPYDSFEAHIEDTIVAGDYLNHRDVVRVCVEEGPARLAELMALGVAFDRDEEDPTALDLTREGGHSARRVVHAKDMTGAAVENALVQATLDHPRIHYFEHHHAIDLISKHRLKMRGADRCLGVYALDTKHQTIHTFLGKVVMLATGGAGKVYRYTSNPDVATGDGIAMAWRVGVPIVNMEFYQFHPTCLYHPEAKNFLVTEACRGEGGILRRADGTAFMVDYHPLKDLAPRDIVARAIDSEMKRTGDPCVFLDMTHLPREELEHRFPGVMGKLLEFGIDMRKQPIPVVPAAHYCCGGVQTDIHGRTSLPGLVAAGEVAHTGLHGANRLASNSLLEGLVFAHRAALVSPEIMKGAEPEIDPEVPDWNVGLARDPDENVLVSHAWEEVRSLMWNYVGIVRSNGRLERAKHRIDLLNREIKEDYWRFTLTRDFLELRNLAKVAALVIESAMQRRECRGLHFTIDYPGRDDINFQRDTVLVRGRRF
jgi:L-aspartate oxidase